MHAERLRLARTRVVHLGDHVPRLRLRVVIDLYVVHHRAAGNAFGVDQFEPVIVGVGLEVSGKDRAQRVVVRDAVLLGFKASTLQTFDQNRSDAAPIQKWPSCVGKI